MASNRKPLLRRLESFADLAWRNPHRLRMAYALRLRRAGWLPLRRDRIGPVRFRFDDQVSALVRTMRTGEYEYETVAAMRHFLKRGSVLLDVGANMGYMCAWGLRIVGPAGEVHAIEPAALMNQRLEALRQANPRHKLVLHRVAAGDAEGEADLMLAGDGMMGDTSIVPGLIVEHEARGRERVRVVRLDAYLDRRIASRIGFIKIDVEGFEPCVLHGMEGWFRDGIRPPIACEIMPRAAGLLGRNPQDTFRFMETNGYVTCNLRDFRPVPPNRIFKLGVVFNVIFLPREVASAN